MITLIILSVWLVCSVLSYGFLFASLQKSCPITAKENYKEDKRWAINQALFGPITLMMVLMNGAYKHGLKFK